MGARPIPDGYHTVTPYLIIRDAAKAIAFYERAFGAELLLRLDGPGGTVGHAEMRIGDSHIMLGDEVPDMGYKGPEVFGGSPVSLHLYVEDSDDIFQRAVAAGATAERPMEDRFYGDRSGTVRDPFGHTWHISTHKVDITQEEIQRRANDLFGK